MAMASSPRAHQWLLDRDSLFRIFILEGLLTIFVSIGAFFFVPTWPQKTKWVFQASFLKVSHVYAAVAIRRRAISPPGSSGF